MKTITKVVLFGGPLDGHEVSPFVSPLLAFRDHDGLVHRYEMSYVNGQGEAIFRFVETVRA